MQLQQSGLYELLRMRDIQLFSIEGILTWVALAILLMPASWSDNVFEMVGYTKIEMTFAIVLMLLIYTVVVKNRFTFDHAAFSVMGVLYVGIGFYYLIETRLFGIEYVVYALMVIWVTDSGAYFTGRKIGKRKALAGNISEQDSGRFCRRYIVSSYFCLHIPNLLPNCFYIYHTYCCDDYCIDCRAIGRSCRIGTKKAL